jgi:hypothetical protein
MTCVVFSGSHGDVIGLEVFKVCHWCKRIW